MLLIGLTGGIGSGKSTVADLLKERGLPIVDADQIARDIVEPGQPALLELADAFGADILNPDGSLNRGELAARAFATPEATAKLNSITHPRIQAETTKAFAEAQLAGHNAVIYDMPLLVDNGLHAGMSMTVVVDVAVNKRVQRLTNYRNMPEADARARIAAQIDDSTRLAAADVIIDNNGEVADLIPLVDALVAKIQALAAQRQS